MCQQRTENCKSDATVDSWSSEDEKIVVRDGPGGQWDLTLHTKVDAPPEEVYDILTNPATDCVFRSIKECTYRKLLREDGNGKRVLEVGHIAIARFLFLSITFETRLLVWQDSVARKIRFTNARDVFMKRFEGSWHVQPFTQGALDHMKDSSHQHIKDARHLLHSLAEGPQVQQQPQACGLGLLMQSGLPDALAFLQRLQPQSQPSSTLVTLEQVLQPKVPPPPGVRHLIKGLCTKQVRDMMEDLRQEADRRKNGTSTTVGKKFEELRPALEGAPVACMSMQQRAAWQQLWQHVQPINITIRL